MYCIMPTPIPASLSSLGRPCCTQFSTLPPLRVIQWIWSQLPSHLPPELPQPDWPPWSTALILLDHGLLVHLQTRSIIATKCISNLPQLRPPSSIDQRILCASQNSLDYGLGVHVETGLFTASKCISRLLRLWPPSSHDGGLQMNLQARLITASKCIFNHARLRPSSWQNCGLQAHLQIRSIKACKCISKLTRSQPRSASLSSLHGVVKLWSEMADIPSSTLRRTSHDSRREFVRNSGSGSRRVWREWEDMKGYRPWSTAQIAWI